MAEAVARRSYGKLVALLAARTGDVAGAEDALSEAFTAALANWPSQGCPDNPEGWLMSVARRRSIDASRSRQRLESARDHLRILSESSISAGESAGASIPDQRLALMFACAHPAIDAGIRSPLILQVILGLDAKVIASAFLMSPMAMGKRLVRAKEKIRQAGIPFRIPEAKELPDRLNAVLEAVYAAFTEGWTDALALDTLRFNLTTEAIYLSELLAELLPAEPEAIGLLSLLLQSQARRAARRTAQGAYVPFAEQDMELWDWQMIRRAEELLRLAAAQRSIGRYQLEAALQSAHVHRRCTGESNWSEIVRIYDALLQVTDGSPVVAVNRALAVAELDGPQAGICAIEGVAATDARLNEYQPYWAAKAELLAKAGAYSEAQHAYLLAIGLERDPSVRDFLQRRQRLIEFA
jgi:predicted RNA polymerase sigma factor